MATEICGQRGIHLQLTVIATTRVAAPSCGGQQVASEHTMFMSAMQRLTNAHVHTKWHRALGVSYVPQKHVYVGN